MTSFQSETPLLKTSVIFSEDQSQLMYNLTKFSNDVGNAVNIRDIGLYDLSEQVCGQQYFTASNNNDTRPVLRKVFNIGAIGTGATVNTPTGITGVTIFTRIYGVAQVSTTQWRPLPFVSTAAVNQQVSIEVLNVAGVQNIQIISGAAATAVTNAIVVLEYVKT